MKLDISFEEQVLSKALRDVAYLKRAARICDVHHFGTKQHAWIWKQMRDVWDTYREPCTPKMLVARARREFSDETDRAPYLQLAAKLLKKKPRSAAASLDELSRFVRFVNAQLALEKSAKALEGEDLDTVYETMRTVSQRDLKPREYTRVRWMEEFEERQAERKHRKEHPEDYTSVATGFKRLDRVIGGVQLGELALVLGTTGRGKSIFLNNIAYHAMKTGHKVAYFGFEMPARQIAMRQDARWLQMAYKKFKDYEFQPSELRDIRRRLKRMKSKWNGHFEIFSMPVRSADINAVRAALDDAYSEDKFRAQVLIFDSADHLLPTGRSESFRLDQANVYWACKGLAEEEGYAVWSSTQAGKEYANKTATAESASESYDKGRISDMMVTLNEPKKHSRATKVIDDDDDDEEPEDSMTPATRGRYLEMHLAKYRDGESRITIPLDAEFEKMLMQEAGTPEAEPVV